MAFGQGDEFGIPVQLVAPGAENHRTGSRTGTIHFYAVLCFGDAARRCGMHLANRNPVVRFNAPFPPVVSLRSLSSLRLNPLRALAGQILLFAPLFRGHPSPLSRKCNFVTLVTFDVTDPNRKKDQCS